MSPHESIEYPCVVIGVDPGGTTGVAVFGFASADTVPEYVEHFQWDDPWTAADQINTLYRKWAVKFPTYLVIEQFDKRPGIIDPDYTPKYINRDVARAMTDVEIVWQTPSMAKNLVKPPKKGTTDGLKRFGWYNTSNRHANDAARHVIVFAVEKMRHKPTVLRGWPRQ